MVLRRSSRGGAGFTLVEVLVSIALVAIALLAIAPLFTGSLRSNAAGWDLSSLNALAKQQLEQALQYDFDDPRLAVPSGATFSIVNQDGTTSTGLKGQAYLNQLPTTQTDGTTTTSFPYVLVYTVQDFPMSSIVSGSAPDSSTAVDDANSSWTTSQGAKLVTVYVASSREALQGTTYRSQTIIPVTYNGKQIRMCALKTP